MPLEIERKFLVAKDFVPTKGATAHKVKQGYILDGDNSPLTVRVRTTDEKAYLSLKGRNIGISRAEYEYEIPLADAKELFPYCGKALIEKTRYLEKYGGHIWEVDVFAGDNAGLIVAEIELSDVDEKFSLPPWVREEVSDDSRYYNVNLVKNPFCQWKKTDHQ